MAFRYWISGPRILGGLVRPGVSFYARLGFVLAVASASASSAEAQVAGPTKSQCMMACIDKFNDCEFKAKCWSSTACEAVKQLRGEGTEKERLKKCHADHLECLGPCAANIWR